MEYKCLQCKKPYASYKSLWNHNHKYHDNQYNHNDNLDNHSDNQSDNADDDNNSENGKNDETVTNNNNNNNNSGNNNRNFKSIVIEEDVTLEEDSNILSLDKMRNMPVNTLRNLAKKNMETLKIN